MTQQPALDDDTARGTRPHRAGLLSIDADPELFHGLTIWGRNFGAQIQRTAVPGPSFPDDFGTIGEVSSLVLGGLFVNEDTMKELQRRGELRITAEDAIKLRDLLNLATARGYLR